MPPRFAFWTILIDNRPTAFRAKEQADLLPTLRQLRRTNTDVVLKWFANGRLWESPDEARLSRRQRPADEPRGKGWRPGGEHRDPRARPQAKGAPRKRESQRPADRRRDQRHEHDRPAQRTSAPGAPPRATPERSGQGGRPHQPWKGGRPVGQSTSPARQGQQRPPDHWRKEPDRRAGWKPRRQWDKQGAEGRGGRPSGATNRPPSAAGPRKPRPWANSAKPPHQPSAGKHPAGRGGKWRDDRQTAAGRPGRPPARPYRPPPRGAPPPKQADVSEKPKKPGSSEDQ